MENEKVFYFPPDRGERGEYMENLEKHLLPVHKDYDITVTEMTNFSADTKWMVFVMGRIAKYNKAASDYIKTRDTSWLGDPDNENLALTTAEPQPLPVEEVPPGVAPKIYARLKSLVFRLRDHPNMTATVAKKMGLDTWPTTALSKENFNPKLTGKAEMGEGVLDCPVRGFSGYEVWAADSETGEYVLIGVSVGRKYIDKRPIAKGEVAEVRYYKVRMLNSSNTPIGEYSTSLKLTLTKAI